MIQPAGYSVAVAPALPGGVSRRPSWAAAACSQPAGPGRLPHPAPAERPLPVGVAAGTAAGVPLPATPDVSPLAVATPFRW